MVYYKVKPERVEENEKLVRAVYEELASTEPDGIRYATIKLDDGLTFVHFAVNETDGEGSPLTKLTAFKEFQKNLRDRVDEGPVRSEFGQIGSFRLMGEVVR